jgi:hypothetical protein
VDGVNSTTNVDINVGSTYTVDLGTIFTDDDGDTLTYKVSVNNSSSVSITEQYSYTADAVGVVTLIFTASDGLLDSDAYTVVLTVMEATTPTGYTWIYTSNGWKKAIPYVYDGNGWKKAIPYIYNGKQWKKAQ